jgi:UDPglucose--hexose-1-phosphate uridylyltransferase
MSELRYNLVSGEWVVIATERAKRPEDFLKAKEKNVLPEYRADCPFCPGNEVKTPGEIYRLGDQKSWKVRSVTNLFGAFSPDTPRQRNLDSIYLSMGGFGVAEVLIEHPLHNMLIPLMRKEEVEDIIRMYKLRYAAMTKVDGIEAITIFKNHGARAGTSIEHPHSQMIATPIVPPQMRSRVEKAVHYFDMTGTCVFCKMMEEELKCGKRLVFETEKFVAFMPFASPSPFTTWIFPRRHEAYFAHINDDEIKDLAINLKTVLQKLYCGLDNPDYNFTLRSIPVKERGTEYFHWYISIIPRLTQPAGFELGSGMFINTSLPEEAAEFLRQVKI